MDFKIKCPFCDREYDGLDYVIESEEMEGEFNMFCEDGCGKEFRVKFKTIITFQTEK